DECQTRDRAQRLMDVRSALERLRSYGGPSSAATTAEAAWAGMLADLYADLDAAGQLGLLNRLPDRGEARQGLLSVLRMAGAGRKDAAAATLAKVTPKGDLDRKLSQELRIHLSADLLPLLPGYQGAAQGEPPPVAGADQSKSSNPFSDL